MYIAGPFLCIAHQHTNIRKNAHTYTCKHMNRAPKSKTYHARTHTLRSNRGYRRCRSRCTAAVQVCVLCEPRLGENYENLILGILVNIGLQSRLLCRVVFRVDNIGCGLDAVPETPASRFRAHTKTNTQANRQTDRHHSINCSLTHLRTHKSVSQIQHQSHHSMVAQARVTWVVPSMRTTRANSVSSWRDDRIVVCL